MYKILIETMFVMAKCWGHTEYCYQSSFYSLINRASALAIEYTRGQEMTVRCDACLPESSLKRDIYEDSDNPLSASPSARLCPAHI